MGEERKDAARLADAYLMVLDSMLAGCHPGCAYLFLGTLAGAIAAKTERLLQTLAAREYLDKFGANPGIGPKQE